ncbi:Defensin-like protein 313 [Arabidopsis thaliana]|uniref:Defensin-like protein 313 n=4 Tax=Arabidopsis TaxID=3701 RepID=DF313_ARATH|nr:Defensin-like (DEFL) family protein [Arabidopsis thaliana]Q3E8K0.2 RecName: Full=Defensin-like protein 313; Flags: Precursor [Arabidopsis thaliana]KAG7604369.1 hypothetical protein ISN45_At05g034540 [Arabidopsis thaliana x Arabidopsis arenosa]KAG7611297.1 hypothetical protein ISN44_As05g034090 [Arabidopsis suecica]AED94514.1 Defensin-like (DEFL) family protein [Arabidopsis thaliana]OAO96322.1 hypothetical protein AXX17_AT5G37790 [Arabidopsis thaliana]CAA0406472.1 unnamed protein product [A|eukprot:NP_568576.2 Defensin-like (DEFL) family protein [Arabidopsis thaliana]
MESKRSSSSPLLILITTIMIIFIISGPKSVDADCKHPVGPYTDSCFTDCVSGKYGYNYESAFCSRDETGTCKICCCELINE